ncbi:bacterio-opsin activator domain-containing protein [Halostella sp. PRR32]|uniref:helix-turn-helix domain-containing protein n=1 Tax=Halostella sp. PRR32 TaxID=3098147 RepID=UPI002B1DDBCE|nr:bacterio-opsin activator domain-containing protein [Halostella sp. PRR32]
MSLHEPSANPVCEVEFSFEDSRYPFVDISKNESCQLDLAEMLPRTDGRYAEYFHVSNVKPERVAAYATEMESIDITILAKYEEGGSLEFLVSGDCPAYRLTELGGLPRQVQGIDGRGRLVAEIPAEENPSEVIETFLEEHPDTSLLSKKEKDGIAPRFPDAEFRRVLQKHLTDRQREILKAAFEGGYYEWPRECTGEDIAEEFDITSATFSEHIQAAERKLLTVMFNGPEAGH